MKIILSKQKLSIRDIKVGECFTYKDSPLYHIATTTPHLITDMGKVDLVTFCLNDYKLYYHYFSIDALKDITKYIPANITLQLD